MTPKEVLEKYFGFREFLDAQEEVVNAILGGDDALVVMPTGGGKSLCYQLPALILEGVTVVVSPLIALMKDQVDALERRGISATVINSTLSADEQRTRIRRLAQGDFKLVYIAPERFRHRAFTEALGQATISLFAIDEAHCMSQWGHDFRPDYFRLGEALEKLGRPQCAAFTATATPEVRRDILERLALREPREFVAGFARPNLRLAVQRVGGEAEKYERLRALVKEHRTGIVYCATRKRVEAVHATLASWKIKVNAYHGGLSDSEREFAQNQFITKQVDVTVATNAFGMGIDRSDIRFVAHFEVPGSVEAYYQEAGRAGRDGEPGVCELLFNYADTRVQDFFIEGANPSREIILATYEVLRRAADPATGECSLPVREIAGRVEDTDGSLSGAGNEMAVSSALSVLNRVDAIDRFDIPGERTRGTRVTDLALKRWDLKVDWAGLQEKERRDRNKLRRILDFVDARMCRQESILRYFGEPDPARCGNCDVCLSGAQVGRRAGDEAEVTILRKALSGVARMNGKNADGAWQGRFGKGRIIQTLLGSRSKEILDARLDQLSTHGLLKEEGQSYVNELFREMQEAGLVAIEQRTGFDGKPYALLALTPLGDAVMRGRQTIELAWPERGSLRPVKRSAERGGGTPRRRGGSVADANAADLPKMDADLLAAMKRRRFEMAKERNLPAYNIFPDATLECLARLRPTTVESGRHIRGVGEVKAERYLPAFIELIQEHAGSGT